MKRILPLLLGTFLLVTAHAQTAEEILAKYETAAGGRDKLQAIKTLETFSNVKISVMGQNMELPVTSVKEKGKLYRRQVGGIMGMGESFTLITDTAGYIYVPPMRGFGPMEGTPAVITQLKPEELSTQQYELDCAGAFPELVGTAAKGHTAELVGTEKVNKVPSFKIRLTLKTGQQLFYFINSETFLVNRIEAFGDMAANLTGFGSMMKAFGRNIRKDMKATLDVKEYQDYGGIKYPSKLKMSLASLDSEVENTTVKFNEGVEEKWYKVK
ncbi:outer membrane lipoprotein-sorting protein [Sediminibacterium soli]|uniref:outer membrane lipoprotein-sorting protein n=1 Tax=Sediminibacterium soli TaxID=2698829 RepID=UPI00137A968D|nr:outer membrane lipoprotein-sorting protein [Sediminibacterium soli]NCI47496.1 outer membrane lipoprotein-sorting protein [Sediminibacterium soli]